MKTSRTKSFRLHHVNKTTSLRKTSQSFMDPDESFKLAALNSVSKGVKMADLSMVTGNDLNKLRVEPLQPKDGQQLSAHCNLMEVRERYNEMKKKTVESQKHISKQKEQLNKLNIFKQELQDKQKNAKNSATSLETRLTDIRSLLQETTTELKVLLNMRSRHNTDKVVYDQRKFDLEMELKHKRKQLNIFHRQGLTTGEQTDRTTRIYEKLQAELQEEQHQREEHIQNLENMIEQKLALINVNEHREAELSEIASRAIQDKAQTQKHWRMVYLTHVFVNKMLRDKIASEMEKFKTVEQAFKTIKTATGVSDAKNLVNKYLNKENVYGELLGKISDNQKVITDLKNEGDKLIQESKELQAEKEVLQSVKIKSQDLHDDIKQFQEQDNKSIIAYSFSQKMKQWVNRQLKKLSILTGAEEKHQTFSQGMENYLNIISGILDSVEEANLVQDQAVPGNQEKVVRVMPKRSRKNSMGEEIFDVDEEELNPGINNEQSDFINAQHDELIQTNEKFMKEVKRKAEEERKLLIEKMESKVKQPVKAPEPKKQQE